MALPLESMHRRRSRLGFGGCFADKSLIDGDFHQRFIQPLFDSRRLALQMGLLGAFSFLDVERLPDIHDGISSEPAHFAQAK